MQMNHYIHRKPQSLSARAAKLLLKLMNRKHVLRKEMHSGSIPQEPAKIPTRLRPKAYCEYKSFAGHGYWLVSPKPVQTKHHSLAARAENTDTLALYLHGGAYVHNMTKYHWNLIDGLLEKTSVPFLIPDYPLAPTYTCVDTIDFMQNLYNDVVMSLQPERLIVMGDSAGGGLALSLGSQWKQSSIPPHQLILIAPWLDISMSHPQIPAFAATDLMLDIEGPLLAGRAYRGSLAEDDWRHSPKYADINGVAPIALFIGSNDMLYADILDLRNKLQQLNHTYQYFEYPDMFHVWPAVTMLPEAKQAIDQLAKLIYNP